MYIEKCYEDSLKSGTLLDFLISHVFITMFCKVDTKININCDVADSPWRIPL